MADINSQARAAERGAPERGPRADAATPDPAPHEDLIQAVELLFFAYRDFTSEPDAILAEFGFGRAHHRVLHFIDRNPGLRVAALLDILKITKQSLNRVLKQLIDEGYVASRTGADDRRERLLFATRRGAGLAGRLAELQSARVAKALAAAGPDAAAAARRFLFMMISESERPAVEALLSDKARSGATRREVGQP